ncbi:MAG: helix-turn-helix domain-containing protein [Chitinispirillaceae bacterium]
MARISKNQLIKLQKKYRTDQAIANLYGLTRQEVHRMRKMYDIAPVANRQTQRNIDIITLHEKGIAVSRIADKYGLSHAHVYRIIRGNNSAG